jgi:hypothetical protein
VYFGQDFPKGDISSDDIKVNFAKLGAGYSHWITVAAEAIEKKQDISEVLDAAADKPGYSKADFIKSHFFPLYDPSKHYPSSPDHTALSPSSIQTFSQSRQTSYVNSLSWLSPHPLQLLCSQT